MMHAQIPQRIKHLDMEIKKVCPIRLPKIERVLKFKRYTNTFSQIDFLVREVSQWPQWTIACALIGMSNRLCKEN